MLPPTIVDELRLIGRSEIAEEIKSRITRCKWRTLDTPALLKLIKELGRYAILSHTWFQGKPGDVVYSNWKERELNPEGNKKIVNFCNVAARKHGVMYGWMDTICIDKSSSTELDESIRSMYRWYRQSHVCIIYLADTSTIADMHSDKWFTRGWTLQELLAPRNMVFYDKDWFFLAQNNVEETNYLGHKINTFPGAVQSQILHATTIKGNEMGMCFEDPERLPMSRIFQLASYRQVTRNEDSVYSLMGILGVSILVAYGEGLRSAFTRLIREIMATKANFLDLFNHSNQYQIIPIHMAEYEQRSSLFDRTVVYKRTELHQYIPSRPISMTHLGGHVPVLLVPLFHETLSSDAPIFPARRPISVEFPGLISYNYHVLQRDDKSAKFISNLEVKETYSVPNVIFLGILNVWKFSSEYHTSNRWLYVNVSRNFGSKSALRLINDIDARELNQMSGPRVVSWTKEHSPGYEIIMEQDLREMGMQFTTLYLS
ncbi:hypothetical protein HYPSUDRAFT_40800 [Hypholoma sublateritium FD-334 SS-4]|uniref:Heterokaryon incompatibility domain-containing protein n=1 Tax=Hypholoma sublateritium (strain FD-334 SS-4) TaxID=945553 RepID=A0A0D2NV85_HYPSF|nr:hypothetical protein HYPSUDRAFT_40800 [Hypholoma sublateritium FD-334 SS-4]